jgi:hypothetical protein
VPQADSLIAVPVIAVFTKYDELIERANFEIDSTRIEGLSNEDIIATAKRDAEKKLQEICVKPFEDHVGDKVPHITVSSKSAMHSASRLLRLLNWHINITSDGRT